MCYYELLLLYTHWMNVFNIFLYTHGQIKQYCRILHSLLYCRCSFLGPLSTNAESWSHHLNWYVTASVVFELSRHAWTCPARRHLVFHWTQWPQNCFSVDQLLTDWNRVNCMGKSYHFIENNERQAMQKESHLVFTMFLKKRRDPEFNWGKSKLRQPITNWIN